MVRPAVRSQFGAKQREGEEAGVSVGCSICAHPARAEIDAALIAGASTPSVARDFGVGRSSVARHAKAHLAASIALAAQRRDEAAAVAILAKATGLYEHCAGLLGQADRLLRGDPDSTAGITAATRVIRETRGILEFVADALDAVQEETSSEVSDAEPLTASIHVAIRQWGIRQDGGRRVGDGTVERVAPCPQCGDQPEPQPHLYPSVVSPEMRALDPRHRGDST
jgi:hypothetical protein